MAEVVCIAFLTPAGSPDIACTIAIKVRNTKIKLSLVPLFPLPQFPTRFCPHTSLNNITPHELPLIQPQGLPTYTVTIWIRHRYPAALYFWFKIRNPHPPLPASQQKNREDSRPRACYPCAYKLRTQVQLQVPARAREVFESEGSQHNNPIDNPKTLVI